MRTRERFPDDCVLLLDTYDTLEGARHAAQVGRELVFGRPSTARRAPGLRRSCRAQLTVPARAILDAAGLSDTTIFVSGNLDEHAIAAAVRRRAPIDAFGVGSRLGTSADAPYLDMAYKLVVFDSQPVLKLSTGKATWPAAKQVWRSARPDGSVHDCIGLADEYGPDNSLPLLEAIMQSGRRTAATETLQAMRERARRGLAVLAPEARWLEQPVSPAVDFSAALREVRQGTTERLTTSKSATASLGRHRT